MNENLRSNIEEIVGEIKSVILLDDQGCTSEVYKIKTVNGFYILKSSFKEKYREWLKAEALVLEKLKNQNLIHVPNFHGFIEETDSSHLIMSFEDGVTLTYALKNAKSIDEKKILLNSFGFLLYQLHVTENELLDNQVNWLNEQLIRAERYVKSGQTEGSLQLLEKLKSNRPSPVKQTIIHGDCTTDNVLVINGEVKLFIDVSGMTVGDPRYDESLAISSFINNEEYKKAFYEGYKRYMVSKEEFEYFDEGLYEFF